MRISAAALAMLCALPASAIRVERIPVVVGPGPAGGVPGTGGYEAVAAEEAVVWFAHYVSTAQRAALVQSVGGAILSEQPRPGWTHVSLAPSMSVANALPVLRGMSGVLRAEPNRVYAIAATANDPLFASQYHFGKISASDGWDFETGSSSRTTIAIIDTGIEGTHPDLSAKMAGLAHKACLDSCADEAGGVATAACEHATEVAGLAAAATDNGTMVSGVSWGSQLLSMRVFAAGDCTASCGDVTQDSCSTSDTRVANALDFLVTQQNTPAYGHIVANLSLGCLPGGACSACDTVIQDAITAALGAGIVVVAAAGNSGPGDNTVNTPGRCAGVIPVTATDESDALASFSSRGAQVAANGLAAPGSGLTSTTIGGTTKTGLRGTSFASPIVAGAAALILSKKPTATVGAAVNEVQSSLRGTAENVGLSANLQGAGRLNLYRALRFATNGTLVSVAGEQKPTAFPNPFRPGQAAAVSFHLPLSLNGGAAAKTKVYTLDGQLVRELTGLSWDGKNAQGSPVASGTYVFVVTTSAGTGRGRLSVLR